jgi:hypothetical protein
MLAKSYGVHSQQPVKTGPRGYSRQMFVLPWRRMGVTPAEGSDASDASDATDTKQPADASFATSTAPPKPAGCARWVDDHWCGRTDGLRRYQAGMLCPEHNRKEARHELDITGNRTGPTFNPANMDEATTTVVKAASRTLGGVGLSSG